jgi:hypothetical protein
MRLKGEQALLEITPTVWDTPHRAADTDLLLNVTVRVSNYSAADQSWVVGDEWQRFLDELRMLEARRQGSAVLEGASPEELRVEFFSTDSLGHMAVRGHVGGRWPSGHFLQLQFSFDFEPDRVPTVLMEFLEMAGSG